ncbi:MAG: nucleotidyl transferase AbiEii/AbiGii toxin family protein [Acidimicrobiales bacterium]
MNAFEAAARRVTGDLAQLGRPCALVGGFAVSARTEPRFTQDLDLAVAVEDDEAAEAAVRSLLEAGYQLLASVEHQATNRLATARLELPLSDQIADLLFASSGIEPEIVAAAEPLEVLPGLGLAVARTGHLIALKLLARDDETRPLDVVDLRALVAAADDAELALARRAVETIEERGYSRGRDLTMALDAFVRP